MTQLPNIRNGLLTTHWRPDRQECHSLSLGLLPGAVFYALPEHEVIGFRFHLTLLTLYYLITLHNVILGFTDARCIITAVPRATSTTG